jgi:membrane-associated phospholipid phosphatase
MRARACERFGVRGALALGVILVAAVAVGIVVVLLRQRRSWLRRIDVGAADGLNRYATDHPGFVTAMKTVSNVSSPVVWGSVLALTAIWFMYRGRAGWAAFVAVTAVGSWLLNLSIKVTVGRARPIVDDPVATAAGRSFPSGHTQWSVIGCGILLLIFLPMVAPRWRSVLVAGAALVVLLTGFSRIALGVHYVSDVAGAIVIGSVWLIVMTWAWGSTIGATRRAGGPS